MSHVLLLYMNQSMMSHEHFLHNKVMNTTHSENTIIFTKQTVNHCQNYCAANITA